MAGSLKNARYVEPADFIPKEIRKELKLGEFAEHTLKKPEKKVKQGQTVATEKKKKG